MLSVADHVRRVTGKDPAAQWRGTYHDEAGARALYVTHGDLVAFCGAALAGIGLRLSERAPGAVVVAEMMGHQVAGIDLGRRVMFRTERGVIDWPAKVLLSCPL